MRRGMPPYVASPHDRVADRAEMHADLVRAPGVDRDADAATRPAGAAPTSRASRPLRARRARVVIFCRCVGSRPIGASMRRPRCTSPHTSATYSFSTSRSWNCRASSGARRRSWPPPSRRTCPCRAGARCPGRISPPTPLRSSTWCSSAFTSVPSRVPRPGARPCPPALLTTTTSRVLEQDVERHVLGRRLRRPRAPATSTLRLSWPAPHWPW